MAALPHSRPLDSFSNEVLKLSNHFKCTSFGFIHTVGLLECRAIVRFWGHERQLGGSAFVALQTVASKLEY